MSERADRRRERYANDPVYRARITETNKRYRDANRQKVNAQALARYYANREAILQREREARLADPEPSRVKKRKWLNKLSEQQRNDLRARWRHYYRALPASRKALYYATRKAIRLTQRKAKLQQGLVQPRTPRDYELLGEQ